MADDPRIAQYEQERADAIDIAHRAMATSYIGAPPANLRGDADRMVAALLKAGWTPPSETVVEYVRRYNGVEVLLRADDQDLTRCDPIEAWVETLQRYGTLRRRRVIVVEDWTELPRG